MLHWLRLSILHYLCTHLASWISHTPDVSRKKCSIKIMCEPATNEDKKGCTFFGPLLFLMPQLNFTKFRGLQHTSKHQCCLHSWNFTASALYISLHFLNWKPRKSWIHTKNCYLCMWWWTAVGKRFCASGKKVTHVATVNKAREQGKRK